MSKTPSTTKKKGDFAVTRKVPIPVAAKQNRYPDLEVGESFFVPHKTHNQLYGTINHRLKTKGQKHLCRVWEEKGVKGLRVWRTE